MNRNVHNEEVIQKVESDLKAFISGEPISAEYEYTDDLSFLLDWSCTAAPDLTYVVASFAVDSSMEPKDTGWPIHIEDVNARIDTHYTEIVSTIGSVTGLNPGRVCELSETHTTKDHARYFLTVHLVNNVN